MDMWCWSWVARRLQQEEGELPRADAASMRSGVLSTILTLLVHNLHRRTLTFLLVVPNRRTNDILLLAKHFAMDYCRENELDPLEFSDSALQKLKSYSFPGNVRELKSIIDLACVLSDNGTIGEDQTMLSKEKSIQNIFESELSLKEINEKIIRSLLEKYLHSEQLC